MTILKVLPVGDLFVEITIGDDNAMPMISLSLDIVSARILAEALTVYYQEADAKLQANRKMLEDFKLLREKEIVDKKARREAKKKQPPQNPGL